MRLIQVPIRGSAARDVPVYVGSGELGAAASRLAALSGADATWAVIADSNVLPLYGGTLLRALEAEGLCAHAFDVPAGEEHKTRERASQLQDDLIAAGLGRDAWVLALGGGVVGDLAGFVAATLFRGVALVQAPTSLLAMVDSSVGGKTGVDTPAGKNLIGAFHQPRAVIADLDTLETLPPAELAAGLAEVIKYGVILDADLFVELDDGLLESCLDRVPAALERIVARSVELKAEVVSRDEHEASYREILNFGHTVGHAIESATAFGLRHGEAIAVGMVVESLLATRLAGAPEDLGEQIADLCGRAGLPVRIPDGCDPAALVAIARRDKKVRGGRIRCALPSALGSMEPTGDDWSVTVEEAALVEAIERATV